MTDATCDTCPSYSVFREPVNGELPCPNGECRRYPPSPKVGWPTVFGDAHWCSEHPDRYQPLIENAEATTLVASESFPTKDDMRRIVEALEKTAGMMWRLEK